MTVRGRRAAASLGWNLRIFFYQIELNQPGILAQPGSLARILQF
jgi:hypothetical protein